MKRFWFMSYIVVRSPGSSAVGTTTYHDDEHPLAKAKRWNDTAGYGLTAVLNFREMSEEEYLLCEQIDIEVQV